MALQNKRIFEYIKGIIKQRFEAYEAKDAPYSFSLVLSFRNNSPADIKIATIETGVALFERKFDEAIRQGNSLRAEKLTFREFDDPELSHHAERTEMRQEIPFNATSDPTERPARRKEKVPTIGLGDIDAIVEKKTETFRLDIEKEKLKLQHERELDEKNRQIRDVKELLEKTVKEKDEEIAKRDEQIDELENALQEASENRLSKLPLGQIASEFATNFLRKNPTFLSKFGIPDATPLLGIGDAAAAGYQPQAQSAPQNDERGVIYNRLIDFCQTLDDATFTKFLHIVVAIENKSVSIDDIYSLVTPSNANSQ